MQARAWLVLFSSVTVFAAIPLAAASYGQGGQIEVNAPVALDGQVDTWLPAGIATFAGSGATQPVGFRLSASEASIRFGAAGGECPTIVAGAPCTPTGQPSSDDQVIDATDVTITVAKALSSYKVVATTDRTYADTPSFGDDGRLLVTSASGTKLDANRASLHLAPSDGAWTDDSHSPETVDPLYQIEAYSAQLTANTPVVLRATGGFETFFQGVQVSVKGTDSDGKPIDETFDTKMPADGRGPWKFLVVEVTDGDLTGSSAAPFIGFAPSDQRPVSDVHSRASFAAATGTVKYADKGDQELASDDITLAGPLSLTLTKITTGSAPRMTYTIVDGFQLANVDEPPTDDPIPPAALAAAGAAGAGGAGALIALAYFWPRLKFWATLLFLPMYTRIERDAVLEHEKRDELYELIRVTPGIHAHEIGEKAHIGWGTTVYHLKLLENHGLIVSKKSGRYKRFFVNTGEYTKKKDIYGALRNETAKGVAQYIVDHPGTTQKEMCAALNIQPSLASWHVEKLEGVELVKRVKDGRMVRYFAGPAWSDLNVRIDPLGGGADAPAET